MIVTQLNYKIVIRTFLIKLKRIVYDLDTFHFYEVMPSKNGDKRLLKTRVSVILFLFKSYLINS